MLISQTKRAISLSREHINMIKMIKRELTTSFGKTDTEATMLMRNADVLKTLKTNPISLHDSPHDWALKILTKNRDIGTLEKYYSN